jgi:hypothetical protein
MFVLFTLLASLSVTRLGGTAGTPVQDQSPREAWVQESSSTDGSGIKAHWNLTDLIASQANAFDSTVADVDRDKEMEIIVSKDSQCQFYCLKPDGSILWQTPVLSSHTPGYYGGEVVDLDADGELEYIAAADSIWALDAATGVQKWTVADVGSLPDETPWTLGHISSPTTWDIIIARAVGEDFLVSVYDCAGNLVWASPILNATYGHTIATKDVDRDGFDEVVVPCSQKTVALDHNGQVMWTAPLASGAQIDDLEAFLRQQGLWRSNSASDVTGWWYHSDFAEIANLFSNGDYYVLHDYGGGVQNPTTVQVLDALSGQVVASFISPGHVQWLLTADLLEDFPGEEIVYVTREKVVMRNSELEILWEKPLSGAHELGIGDWDGDNINDILVSTVFRGFERFAAVDSNFVVYNAFGQVIYNMRYHYPPGLGKYAGAQMQNAMKKVSDIDEDGRVEVAVSFSNHDRGKFNSSQDVHQYIMGMSDINYSNLFHAWGNESTAYSEGTMLSDNAICLSYTVPDREYEVTSETVVLMHMNEASGNQVVDSSLNHNDGTLYEGEWVQEGEFGSAIRFNNPTASCTVPYSNSLDIEQVAIEIWVKAEDKNRAQCIIEKPGAFGLSITPENQLSFHIHDSTASLGNMAHVETPFEAFDRFAHIIASYDGTHLRLIMDGIETITDSHVGAIDQTTEDLYIGNSRDNTMPFQGIVDELRISGSLAPMPFQVTGEWTSQTIFPPQSRPLYGAFEFDHTTNGSSISYDLLDGEGIPLLGHTGIVSSPHDISDVTGPLQVHANLVRNRNAFASPQVRSIHITTRDLILSPAQNLEVSTGSWFSYTHSLTRTGSASATVFITVGAPPGILVTVHPTSIMLYSGVPSTVEIAVQVPSILKSPIHEIWLTATSSLTPLPSTVTDTIKVFFTTYFPILKKNDGTCFRIYLPVTIGDDMTLFSTDAPASLEGDHAR